MKMKLNKMQLNALSNEIINKITKTILDKEKQDFEKFQNNFYKTKEGKALKILEDSEILDKSNKYNLSSIVRNCYNSQNKNPRFNSYLAKAKIENELILSTVDSNFDLEKVINKISEKYLNEYAK